MGRAFYIPDHFKLKLIQHVGVKTFCRCRACGVFFHLCLRAGDITDQIICFIYWRHSCWLNTDSFTPKTKWPVDSITPKCPSTDPLPPNWRCWSRRHESQLAGGQSPALRNLGLLQSPRDESCSPENRRLIQKATDCVRSLGTGVKTVKLFIAKLELHLFYSQTLGSGELCSLAWM